jgi:hypothetical protein
MVLALMVSAQNGHSLVSPVWLAAVRLVSLLIGDGPGDRGDQQDE